MSDHLLQANWIGSVNICQLRCRRIREKVSNLSYMTCLTSRHISIISQNDITQQSRSKVLSLKYHPEIYFGFQSNLYIYLCLYLSSKKNVLNSNKYRKLFFYNSQFLSIYNIAVYKWKDFVIKGIVIKDRIIHEDSMRARENSR